VLFFIYKHQRMDDVGSLKSVKYGYLLPGGATGIAYGA
jgi:hypothetical protein